MISRLKRQLFKEKTRIINVAVKDCVHYCGFKYGGQQYNPYETFIYRYYNEPENIEEIKTQFIEFLRYYYPKSFNEAFGLDMSNSYPLWFFPWYNADIKTATNWVNDPDDIVDIITHFSEKGIPSYKIDQEFYWLTRAIQKMSVAGYKPESYTYIEAMEFEDINGNYAYLLFDGNHRISALHALGETSVKLKVRESSIVREKDVNNWPNVKNGHFSIADALLIFKNYFAGNVRYKTSEAAAIILDYTSNYKPYA